MKRALADHRDDLTLGATAVLVALALHTFGPGWGFDPDVDFVGEYLAAFALVMVIGSTLMAACIGRWAMAWSVAVGVLLSVFIVLQWAFGSEVEPDQRVTLALGPPALVVLGFACGLVGRALGDVIARRSR